MKRQDTALFFAAFFLTLLFSAWFILFLLVGQENAKYETDSGSMQTLSVVQSGSQHYQVTVLGQEYTLSTEWFRQLSDWRKQYACLVTPHIVRVAEQVYSMAVYQGDVIYKQYREEQYIQNVAKSQEGTPVEPEDLP